MGLRVVVTGGSGKAGQHVIRELLEAGHTILNLDLVQCPIPEVSTVQTDLSVSGQVFSAMSGQFKLSEPFPPGLPPTPDAVIHLAGYSRNMIAPDEETYRSNTLSTYNVIEAACKLGIKKIIIASSVTVYGTSFALGDVDFPSFPVDENVDTNPTDTYAIAKLCSERVARGFATRFNADIYALRIGRIVAPEEYNEPLFTSYVRTPEKWKAHGWSYIDARDLGQMCVLGLQKSGLGFRVFNATNDTITNYESTESFLKRVCPTTPFTRPMGEVEAPISNASIKEALGFREQHPWKKYFGQEQKTAKLWEKKTAKL